MSRRRYLNMAHGARFGFDPAARASEIRRLRSVEGWTLRAIARAFGITKPAVHRICRRFEIAPLRELRGGWQRGRGAAA